MKIIIASDHRGFIIKERIFLQLSSEHSVSNAGPFSENSVDYPDFAHLLANKVKKNKNYQGILICGSGTGMSIVANKHKNIRAALCYNVKSAKLSREHNNANVMSIGSRLTKKQTALKCVDTFMKTNFKGGRHLRRIKKI